MLKKTPALLAALALAASLAACSSGGDTANTGANPDLADTADTTEEATADGAAVFDWDIPATEPSKEVRFQLPEGLAEAAKLDDILVMPVSARGVEADEPGECAIEVTYEFPQGQDALRHELRDTEGKAASYYDGKMLPAEQVLFMEVTGISDALIRMSGTVNADGSVEYPGITASADMTRVVYSRSCAPSPYDEDTSQEMISVLYGTGDPVAGEQGEPNSWLDTKELATASLTVMQNGDVTVTEGELKDWQRDSNGGWLPK